MSKTWYGHHIETIKGEDYVLHKDYTELQNKLEKENERLNNIIDELENRDNILEEFEKWLEEQKYRNSEWDNFVSDGVRIGIPRQYIIDKLNELKGNNK